MNSYILLRNNKETGPHNLADLRQIGLKPNDLIWVECQSVGWRNPGEINELKPLLTEAPAPVVDPLPATTAETATGESASKEAITPIVEEEKPAQVTAKKSSVFVALPEKAYETPKKEEPSPAYSQPVKETDRYMPRSADTYIPPVEKEKEVVETKYARSLDDIKELYVKNLEHRKKRGKLIPFKIPKGLIRAAMYAGLIGVGAIVVLLFKNPGVPISPTSQQEPKLPAKFETRPDTLLTDEPGNSLADAQQENKNTEQFSPQITNAPVTRERTVAVEEKRNDPGNAGPNRERTTEPVSLNDKDHKVSIPRNEVPEIKTLTAGAVSDQLSVKTNSYTVAALGGIRNLEMTIQNDSKYHLDKVTVELRYLNPSGVILKTEDIYFKSIEPNGTQTIPVKKSTRGVKVSYKITRIESKEIGSSTAGL